MLRQLLFAALLASAVACQNGAPVGVDLLHPCTLDEGPTEAFCGKYAVWENREAKQGRKIDLKIVVLPALRRDAKPDPIVFFAGGPGEAAASMAKQLAPVFRRFQTDRDIVLVDQRGTKGSNSLACDYAEQVEDDYERINDYPVDKVRACLEKLRAKADLTQYTTSIAMDDMDEVRTWLGYAQVNLWGISYGTRAALTYLQRHEVTVRSAVIDSVAPPDMALTLYMARDGQRALDRLFDSCESDSACSGQFPDLRKRTQELFARLKARPRIRVTHPTTAKQIEMPLSDQTVAATVFSILYDTGRASLVPRLLWDASNGNYQGLLSAAGGVGAADAMSEGMFLSVICAEDFPRIQEADMERETAGRFFGRTMFDTRVRPCQVWPRAKVEPAFYEPSRSAKPVLVFSGADDPVTPPEWGERVARQLSNSRHLIMPGTGHSASPRGCAPQLMLKFFETADVKSLDARCLDKQRRPPFFVNYTGPEAPKAETGAVKPERRAVKK